MRVMPIQQSLPFFCVAAVLGIDAGDGDTGNVASQPEGEGRGSTLFLRLSFRVVQTPKRRRGPTNMRHNVSHKGLPHMSPSNITPKKGPVLGPNRGPRET